MAEQLEGPRGSAAHDLFQQHLAESAPSMRRARWLGATSDGSLISACGLVFLATRTQETDKR